MILKRFGGKWGFICLLWAASVKDDALAFESSVWWSGIEIHPIVSLLKSASPLFFLLFILSTIIYTFKINRYRISGIYLPLLMTVLLIYCIARTIQTDTNLAVKLSFLLILLLSIIYCIVIVKSAIGDVRAREWVLGAFTGFFLIFISVNILHVALGYGFVPGNPRLFGTSAHPNFLGAQSALGAIILLGAVHTGERFDRFVYGIGLIGALTLVILSGSRTGVVIFLTGTSAYYLALRKFRIEGFFPLLGSILVVLLIVAFGAEYLGDAFDRGGINTRAKAYAGMWDQVRDNPIFGAGTFLEFSENSFLRGWAAYGILFPAIMISIGIFTLIGYARLVLVNPKEIAPRIMFSLSCALLAGALLEGYLTDTFSFPIILFACLIGPIRRGMVARVRDGARIPVVTS